MEGVIMSIKVREFKESDIQAANEIWNEVVEEGVAFPQEEFLTEKSGLEFFKSQSYTGIVYDEETGDIVKSYNITCFFIIHNTCI